MGAAEQCAVALVSLHCLLAVAYLSMGNIEDSMEQHSFERAAQAMQDSMTTQYQPHLPPLNQPCLWLVCTVRQVALGTIDPSSRLPRLPTAGSLLNEILVPLA